MSRAAEWQAFRRRLESLKEDVAAEIRSYPPPITGCDAQFNYLLELRRLLPRELERLDLAAGAASSMIETFIRASLCEAALSELLAES